MVCVTLDVLEERGMGEPSAARMSEDWAEDVLMGTSCSV